MEVGKRRITVTIVDQYLGVEILKIYSWDAHIANLVGEGKTQIGEMDA